MNIEQVIGLVGISSTDTAELTIALAKVRSNVTPVLKTGVDAYKKTVANRDDMVRHLQPIVADAGITYGFAYYGMIGVMTVAHLESGQFQRSFFELHHKSTKTETVKGERRSTSEELDPQEPMKWRTYLERAMIGSTFNLVGTDDPDEASFVPPVDESQQIDESHIAILNDLAAEANISVEDAWKSMGMTGDWKHASISQARNVKGILETRIKKLAEAPERRGRGK